MLPQLKTYIRTLTDYFKDKPNLKSIGLLTFWMIASRLLGVVRILLVGDLTTVDAELFNAAFVIADNLIAILIAGSITLSILPQYIELEEDKERKNNEQFAYLTISSSILSALVVFISTICLIFTPQLIKNLNGSFSDTIISLGRFDEFIALNRILLLLPILFAIKTFFGIFLNARRRFFVYSLDGVLTNLGILIGLTLLYDKYGIYGAMWGVVLGFGVSAISFVIDSFRGGFRFNFQGFPDLKNYLIGTAKLYLPRLFFIPSIRITETLITATVIGISGQITAVKTALDIQGIPLGLVTVIATVFLPDITTTFVKFGKSLELSKLLNKYLKLTSLLAVAIGILVSAFSPILFYSLNRFNLVDDNSFFSDKGNIDLIIICTIICCLSLIFQSIMEILSRLYIAKKKILIPLISSVCGNLTQIISTFVLLRFFPPAIIVVAGFSLNNMVQAIILFVYRNT
jgi:putative peptidoglycan lipid II flippase